MDLASVVVLVTGANRGLGHALVEAFLQAGAAKVYAGARDPGTVTAAGAIPVTLDITSPDTITRAAQACGDVNVVINNAGIARRTFSLSADTLADMRAEMDTNYWGPLTMAQAFAPVLARNGGGALVNILSVLSWLSVPGTAGYSASKAAMWSMTNGLRHDLAAQGTQVVGLHVGYMDTDMTAGVDAPKASPAEVARQVVDALRDGRREILADALSRQVKAGLSAPEAVYLHPAGEG
jgi:NAD(P)-dependent dehydrogenase (short-subunit alcohol dehydrogenase family)